MPWKNWSTDRLQNIYDIHQYTLYLIFYYLIWPLSTHSMLLHKESPHREQNKLDLVLREGKGDQRRYPTALPPYLWRYDTGGLKQAWRDWGTRQTWWGPAGTALLVSSYVHISNGNCLFSFPPNLNLCLFLIMYIVFFSTYGII